MAILKLKEAGDTATLEVAAANVVAGQFGEQIRFDTKADETLFLPKDTADRQLDRLGLDVGSAVGEVLTFSRAPSTKPGAAPYWNIAKANLLTPTKPKTNGSPPVAKSNEKKPVSIGRPGFLDGAEAEDKAELDAKIAPDVLEALKVKLAVYQALTEFVLRDIAPIYEKHKVGMSPESSAACVQTLFINATGK